MLDTLALNDVGAAGAEVHAEGGDPTVSVISLDAALVPAEFFARTRTKYVPAGTCVTVSVAAAFPVSKFARSVRPVLDPASTT